MIDIDLILLHSNALYKIVLIGDISVGKSSLMTRFNHDTFDDNVRPTVGVEFVCLDAMNHFVVFTNVQVTKILSVKDKAIKLQIVRLFESILFIVLTNSYGL